MKARLVWKMNKESLPCLLAVAVLHSPLALADDVRYRLMPYLWAAGIDAEIGRPGMTTEADVSFSDYLDFIDLGAAFAFEARRDRWSWGGNLLWVRLGEDFDLPAGTTDLEIEQTILEFFVGFRPEQWENTRIIAGGRYTDISAEIDFVNISDPKGGSDFADPYLGVMWHPRYGDWEWLVEADVGGGVDADFAYSFTVFTGYYFTERLAVTGGYRFIDIDFEDDEFVFDGTFEGIQIGLLVTF